ncbi:MAG TPA: hypothetical protein VM736_04780 [Gemmatimonadales bacterium]|nr:hypothetical protein [Gemmatimonadales bacterium]
MRLEWPVTPQAILAWSETLVAWVLASYVLAGNAPTIERVGTHPARGPRPAWKRPAILRGPLLLLLLLVTLRPQTLGIWILVVLLAGLASLLPFGRAYLADHDRRWGAELEIGTNALVVSLSASFLGPASQVRRPLITLPISPTRLAAIWLGLASLIFLVHGGTHVVRAILARTDAGPLTRRGSDSMSEVDVAEYSRGRVIGAIERIIMAGIVAAGQLSALMFLIGAKGLIRSHRLDDPVFAEYFLIGTLASAALAVGCGFLLRLIFSTLW